jgi:hypothetical protein
MVMQREIAAFCRQKMPCNTCWTVGGVTHTNCAEHGAVPLIVFYEEVLQNNSSKTFLGKFYACPKCVEKEYGEIKDAEEVVCCEICGLAEAQVGVMTECKHCKAKVCKGCNDGGACKDCEDYGVFVC